MIIITSVRLFNPLDVLLGYPAQILVDELHDHGTLPDCRCHALDRPVTHIPCREDAGYAGLEQEGIPVEMPPPGTTITAEQAGPGQDKA